MNTYFATFSPGFAETVYACLQKDIADLSEVVVYESGISFQSQKSYSFVSSLPYFASVFLLVGNPVTQQSAETAYVKSLHKVANYGLAQKHPHPRKLKTFRVMVQKGNQLTGITKAVMDGIKNTITTQTHLIHSPLKADVEFWFVIRNEDVGFIGAKYIHQAGYIPAKGELKPHLAYVLHALSDPLETDTYLDPFTGYGALPLCRALHFPYRHMYAIDSNVALVRETHRKLKPYKRVSVLVGDATRMTVIRDASVDVIVTDPPWGIYERSEVTIQSLYAAFLHEAVRVLTPEGRLVIVSAKKEDMELAINEIKDVSTQKSFSTLVNGKKAQVFLVTKEKKS